jgi:hypothetical protein
MSVSRLDGRAPDGKDFANYFCTYAYLYHQVRWPPFGTIQAMPPGDLQYRAESAHRLPGQDFTEQPLFFNI